jgi:deoxycytidine triphosphate deaminase
MLLPDHEIRRLCKQEAMVSPYVEEHLNPASLDVILGDRIMIEVAGHPELQILGITGHTQEDPFWIQPGEWFLAETREIFNLPEHVGAQFVLKSSRMVRSRMVWQQADHGAEEQPADASTAGLAWPAHRADEVLAGERSTGSELCPDRKI